MLTMRLFRQLFIIVCLCCMTTTMRAQIGEYRNVFAVGVNGGATFTSVSFVPKVTQSQLPGKTAGLTLRYTSEKYFNMICAIVGEVNYTQMGWRENIIDLYTKPVIGFDGDPEKYQRELGYVQVPIMAHLAWGNEEKGMKFFFQGGPQFGYLLSENTTTNFDPDNCNMADRANKTHAQYGMPVENKLDYGICAGIGVEYTIPHLGHYQLEGRYYYGLGNIYGATKADYFARSNQAAIEVKLACLFDLTR